MGHPCIEAARDPEGFDVLALELSSFQLHTWAETWTANRPLVLNISADHLDWHGGCRRIRARPRDAVVREGAIAAIYNVADRVTEELVEEADVVEGARAVGSRRWDLPGRADFGVIEGILVDRAFLDNRRTAPPSSRRSRISANLGPRAPPAHVRRCTGCSRPRSGLRSRAPQAIRDAIRRRSGPAPTARSTSPSSTSVSYVDDSKATNPHAAGGSLRAFPHVVWIVGGLLKGVAIGPLVAEHASRLRAAVVIGADRAEVLEQLQRHAPGVPVEQVLAVETEDVMREAVTKASAVATSGDTVLLAPAAASMDQFKSYADRGDRFQAAVEELKAGRGGADERDDPNRLD